MVRMAETSTNWSEVEVAGHPCGIFEPTRPSESGSAVIYLHGSRTGKLRSYPAFTAALEQHGLRLIQPYTGRSWWTDRIWPDFDPQISAEAYLLETVLPFVAERWGARPPQLALFGASMGGQGALRIAYKHPDLFPVVAAISPAIDFQKRIEEGVDPGLAEMYRDVEDARQDTALLHIHPLNWPRHQFFCCDPTDYRWHESADRLRMKLWSLGVPFECDLETIAGGHSFEYCSHMAPKVIEFLAQGLEAEHLRVV
jgi:pimeloyl-ACP methyl ester carboxylesterase